VNGKQPTEGCRSPTANRSQPPVFSLSRHRIPTPLAPRPSIRSILARPLTTAEPQKKERTNESQAGVAGRSFLGIAPTRIVVLSQLFD